MNTIEFQELVWHHGQSLYRDMPWRQTVLPYNVWVSELMLQQTQVSRVIPKFETFIHRFPTVNGLADARLDEVLIAWSGLGYNRRAKYLWEAAREIMNKHNGRIPESYDGLVSLPGIGPNTAAAIMNYAYQTPHEFVETNIRTVYFHHFYKDNAAVSDKELLSVVASTMDKEHPREWFWALMDYGAYLKKYQGARLDQSSHYKKQAPLKGSQREMRGRIIKALTLAKCSDTLLRDKVMADDRYVPSLQSLEKDGLIIMDKGHWRLKSDEG